MTIRKAAVRGGLGLLVTVIALAVYRHYDRRRRERVTAKRTLERAPVMGKCKRGFGGVKAAVEKLFRDGRETGVQVACYRRGELVVDLAGGWFEEPAGLASSSSNTKDDEEAGSDNRARPLRRSDMIAIFSNTKTLSGICIAVAVSRGMIPQGFAARKYRRFLVCWRSLVEPVVSKQAKQALALTSSSTNRPTFLHNAPLAVLVDLWPRFGLAGGKGNSAIEVRERKLRKAITLEKLMKHEAGLTSMRRPLSLADCENVETIRERCEQTRLDFDPTRGRAVCELLVVVKDGWSVEVGEAEGRFEVGGGGGG